MKRILVIDDEDMIVDVIKVILEDMGFAVAGYQDPEEGVAEAISGDYQLILADLRMPGKNGAQVTTEILAARPDATILIITAYPSDPLARKALDAGATALLKKPFEVAKVLDFLRSA